MQVDARESCQELGMRKSTKVLVRITLFWLSSSIKNDFLVKENIKFWLESARSLFSKMINVNLRFNVRKRRRDKLIV